MTAPKQPLLFMTLVFLLAACTPAPLFTLFPNCPTQTATSADRQSFIITASGIIFLDNVPNTSPGPATPTLTERP